MFSEKFSFLCLNYGLDCFLFFNTFFRDDTFKFCCASLCFTKYFKSEYASAFIFYIEYYFEEPRHQIFLFCNQYLLIKIIKTNNKRKLKTNMVLVTLTFYSLIFCAH